MTTDPSRPEPPVDLLPLLLIDQYLHWRCGERHPALREPPEAVLDLIYHEVVLREEIRENPDLAEYAARFPWLAEPLTAQVRRAPPDCLTDPPDRPESPILIHGRPVAPLFLVLVNLGL